MSRPSSFREAAFLFPVGDSDSQRRRMRPVPPQDPVGLAPIALTAPRAYHTQNPKTTPLARHRSNCRAGRGGRCPGDHRETAVGRTERCALLTDGIIGRHRVFRSIPGRWLDTSRVAVIDSNLRIVGGRRSRDHRSLPGDELSMMTQTAAAFPSICRTAAPATAQEAARQE
jgi:hypothetical protein